MKDTTPPLRKHTSHLHRQCSWRWRQNLRVHVDQSAATHQPVHLTALASVKLVTTPTAQMRDLCLRIWVTLMVSWCKEKASLYKIAFFLTCFKQSKSLHLLLPQKFWIEWALLVPLHQFTVNLRNFHQLWSKKVNIDTASVHHFHSFKKCSWHWFLGLFFFPHENAKSCVVVLLEVPEKKKRSKRGPKPPVKYRGGC